MYILNKLIKGYEKAVRLMEGKSDSDSTSGLLSVVRVGKWLKNALVFGEGTSASTKELQGLKAVEDRLHLFCQYLLNDTYIYIYTI